MQSQGTTPEFEDLATHRKMWDAFSGFLAKSIVATVIVLLIVGWVTGVL